MSSLFIVLACLLWAFDTLIRYPLANSLSSTQIVCYEHILAFSFLCVFSFKSFTKIFKKEYMFSFFIIGSLGSALATVCFTSAFQYLNPSIVILIQKLQPLVAIVLSFFILREKIPSHFILAALLAIIGAIFLSVEDFTLEFKYSHGIFLSLIAVIGWGSATVFGRKLSLKGLSELDIMLGRFMWGALALMPFAYNLNSTQLDHLTLNKILSLVLISGIFGMYAYYRGLKSTEAKIATLLELFFPFFAVIINWIFLGKSLSSIQILGGILLLSSTTYLQLKRES